MVIQVRKIYMRHEREQQDSLYGSRLLAAILSPSYRPDEGFGVEDFRVIRSQILNPLLTREHPTLGSFYLRVHRAAMQLTEQGVLQSSLGFPAGIDLSFELAAIGYEIGDLQTLQQVQSQIVKTLKAKYRESINPSLSSEELGSQLTHLFLLGILFAKRNKTNSLKKL